MPSPATVRPSVERARRVRRIEAAALGMLAFLPFVPYFTFLLRTGVPRFGVIGDLALLEHLTRHVWTGDALVGEPSRFGFSQPGPLFFYFAAPFQAIFAPSSTGIYIAAGLVNGAASAAVVAEARLFARRAHAVAALFVLLGWFAAFGSIAVSPWPPFLVVLPLMAFLFSAAMLARGKSAAAYPATAFGTFAAQTHVASLPLVLVATLLATLAFLVGQRRQPSAAAPDVQKGRWRMGLAAGIALVMWVPPIVEQLVAPTGNLRKIAAFFLHRTAPPVPMASALHAWMTMTAWLPYRVSRMTLLHEGFVPEMASNDPLYIGTTTFPAIVACVHVGAGIVAALIAARRKDAASLGLLAVGALTDAIAIEALQAIVGPSAPYLILWTTAASSILWMGVFSTFFSAIGAQILKVPRFSSAAATPLIFVALTLAVTATSLQRYALAKHPAAIGSHPELRGEVRAAYETLRARMTRDGTSPVVHLEGIPDIALAFFVELEKDRVDVRIADRDRASVPAAVGEKGLTKPLPLWFESAAARAARGDLARCTDVVAKSNDLVVLTGCP